jgi:hypothetical protein
MKIAFRAGNFAIQGGKSSSKLAISQEMSDSALSVLLKIGIFPGNIDLESKFQSENWPH